MKLPWGCITAGEAMERASDEKASPLRRHAADALRRARKLPIGHERNDLRQLATGLLWLERRGLETTVQDPLSVLDGFYT